jgi:hypothetical protein
MYQAESAAVKATANWNDRKIETFGEANRLKTVAKAMY